MHSTEPSPTWLSAGIQTLAQLTQLTGLHCGCSDSRPASDAALSHFALISQLQELVWLPTFTPPSVTSAGLNSLGSLHALRRCTLHLLSWQGRLRHLRADWPSHPAD